MKFSRFNRRDFRRPVEFLRRKCWDAIERKILRWIRMDVYSRGGRERSKSVPVLSTGLFSERRSKCEFHPCEQQACGGCVIVSATYIKRFYAGWVMGDIKAMMCTYLPGNSSDRYRDHVISCAPEKILHRIRWQISPCSPVSRTISHGS